MIRGSGIVLNYIHNAKCFEFITCKGGPVIHYKNMGKSK